MIRTCVLVKRIPIYIDISGGVGTKVAWKLLPGRESKRNGDYLGEWAPQWRGSHCQEERAREMEMQWGVVGSRSPWRKARTLSLQTCSGLYQILRGSSIRRDEHHCGVGFRIQWLDFRILVGWFIPKFFSDFGRLIYSQKIFGEKFVDVVKHWIYLSLWWLVEVLYGRLFF